MSNHDLSALEAAPQFDSMRKSVQSPIINLTYWSDYCTGSLHVHFGSWIPMKKGWMKNKLM